MKKVLLLCFAIGIGCVSAVESIRKCNITCLPIDEFDSEFDTSQEWDKLMNTLYAYTFETPYYVECYHDRNELIELNYTDDIFWKLRFELYSEIFVNTEKTFSDCFCDYQGDGCKSEAFRECMKSTRLAMSNQIKNKWVLRIVDRLEELSQEC